MPFMHRMNDPAAFAARLGGILPVSAVAFIPYLPLALAVALLPLGTAFTFPCVTALLSRVIPSSERGLYMGVQQTFGGTARVLFPIAAGFAFDRYPGLPFIVSASLGGRHDFTGVGYGGIHPAEARTRGSPRGLIRNTRLPFLGGCMLARRVRGAVVLSSLAALGACGGGSSEPSGSSGPSAIDIVSGNGQVQLVGTPLTSPLVVRVTTNGTVVKGSTVTFAVTTGSATVTPTSAVTDAAGQAKAQVTLGSSPGQITITASVSGTSLKATFIETAAASTMTAACQAGPATTPTAGEVRAGVSGTGICLGGGASGAEYALVAFYANTDRSAIAQVGVTARGATAVILASQAPSFNATETLGGIQRHASMTSSRRSSSGMRASARRELRPKIAGAQAWYRRQAAAAAIPANPAIGSLVTLNGNGESNCSNPINVIGRIAAVSTTAIVVADTANPTRWLHGCRVSVVRDECSIR